MIKYRVVQEVNFYGQSRFICQFRKLWGFWQRLKYFNQYGYLYEARFETLKEAEECIESDRMRDFRNKKIIHKIK
tara:strand:- start:56542 stop:56766 length:225 start_codon:yes stop_codon:yes gene_type:complete